MPDYTHQLTASAPTILVEVIPGEPLEVTVPILDADGVPVEVASAAQWSALAQARTDWRATSVLHTFTSAAAGGAALAEGVAGAVVLSATGAQTAGWQAAWTDHPAVAADLMLTDPTGVAHLLARLTLLLLPVTTVED